MDKGVIFSGIGHTGLILWVLIGGFFIRHDDAPEIAVTEVSLMSSAEFEAMLGAAPSAPAPEPVQTEIAAPQPVQPVAEEAPVVPAPDAAPVVAATPAPEPAPQAQTAPAPAESAPQPLPDPAPEPAPPAPAAIEEPPVQAPDIAERPRAKPADRVAPQPTPAPAPDALPDAAPTPAVTPDAAPEAQVVQEEKPETAPEEAGTELATEANKPEPLAPAASLRPRARPSVKPAAPAPEPAANNDAIAAALAEANAPAETPQTAPATPARTEAPAGPPMTTGEKDALRVAVQACWNVGSLSSEALRVTVIVAVSLAENGVPDAGSVRMIDAQGGTDAAARQAFEAARRAVLRCGARGFNLPPEKYEQWRNIELVFNPENMRNK